MCVRGLRTYSTGRVIKIDIWMRQNSNEKCLNIQNTFSFSSTHMPRDKVERGERRVGAKWEAKRIESIIRIQLAFIHNPLTNVDLSEKAHKTNGHSQWIREDKNPMYWYLMHNSATCFVTLIIFVHGPTAATTTKTITRESEKSAHALDEWNGTPFSHWVQASDLANWGDCDKLVGGWQEEADRNTSKSKSGCLKQNNKLIPMPV